ncbi:MAG TPA: MXAN_5187 C-terminal domain-containing protein [Blastocatellia bacterium]
MEAKNVNPIDQELDRFEHDLRRLKIEYDIFFNGGAAKPPLDTKGRVDTTIKRLYDSRGLTFGQRFRYNSLVARYNVMRELWRRQTKGLEATGKAIPLENQGASRYGTYVVRCYDPRMEPDKVCEIYDHLVAAKRACGERIGNLTLELFSDFLNSRVDNLKDRLAASTVDFVVGVKGGRVKFAVRPVGQE